jgi:AmpD protein
VEGVIKMLTYQNGWISGAKIRRVDSPNFNQRPAGMPIDVLVIHNISLPPSRFGSDDVEQFFTNQLDTSQHPDYASLKDVKVSAHLFIKRTGEMIQFVSLLDRAWHAGVSHFQGRQGCNDFSIGIELEGTDDLPFTDAQYQQLVEVTQVIQQHFPLITLDHITGHSDIAPGRKTDPGPCFDWPRFKEKL